VQLHYGGATNRSDFAPHLARLDKGIMVETKRQCCSVVLRPPGGSLQKCVSNGAAPPPIPSLNGIRLPLNEAVIAATPLSFSRDRFREITSQRSIEALPSERQSDAEYL